MPEPGESGGGAGFGGGGGVQGVPPTSSVEVSRNGVIQCRSALVTVAVLIF